MLVYQTLVVLVLVTFDLVKAGKQICTEHHAKQIFFIPGFNCTMQHITILQKQNFNFIARFTDEGATISKLTFEDSTILYMPRKLFDALENLQFLYMSQCNLLKLSKGDFQNAAYLQMLTLAGNKLLELPESVFDGADQLRIIDLSRNQISKIHSGVFKELKNLFMLQLSSNQIKVLADNLFDSNLKIDYLDLSFNLLQSISKEMVKNLTLNIFSVQNNELEFLEVDNNVRVLDASENKLTCEKLHIIASGSKLKILKLSNNQLDSLEFIKNLANLHELDVSKNPLGGGGIIRDNLFTQLTQLKRLNLNSMNLTQLDFRLFANLQNLEQLDVSGNPNINSINFNELTNLKILFLNNLNMQHFDEVTTFGDLFPKLNLIDISDNAWSCSDLQIILNELNRLNVQIRPKDYDRFIVNDEATIRDISCNSSNDEFNTTVLNIELNPIQSEVVYLKTITLSAMSLIGFVILLIVYKFDLRKCRSRVLDSYKPLSTDDTSI